MILRGASDHFDDLPRTIDIPDRPGSGTKEVTITPEIAAAWLERSYKNRKLSEGAINQYARDMERGEWKVTGEAIKFDRQGRLRDGQHRLTAIVRTGVSIRSDVRWGVAEDAFPVMDSGRVRRRSDVLSIEAYDNPIDLSAAVVMIWGRFKTGSFNRATPENRPSKPQTVEWVEQHPEIHRIVVRARAAPIRFRNYPRSLTAALIFEFSKVDPEWEDIEGFYTALGSGTGMDEGDPRALLRRKIYDNSVAPRKMTNDELAAITIKAWNAFRKGQTISRLNWKMAGANPEPFPEII